MHPTPNPVREISLQVGHLRLAGLEWGSENPRKVLALHGWMDNAASFATLAPLLDGLHIVALDFSGHGRSDHPPAAAHPTILDWVPEAVAAADTLGWLHFRLLTHSLGAAVAFLVAATAPERIESLVVLDGYGPISELPDKGPDRLASALKAERRLVSKKNPPCRSFEDALRARGISGPDLTGDALQLLVRRGTAPCADGVRFRHDPRLTTPSRTRFSEEQVQAFLRAVTCPVLAVRPLAGWPLPEGVLETRLGCLQQVERLEVEGGHHVHLTHPERVAPAIQAFFDRS